MEKTTSVIEDLVPPESWEVADVEESMKRLFLSSKNPRNVPAASDELSFSDSSSGFDAAESGSGASCAGLSEDDVNRVDQFLREALQNPRERLSVLRMEQDIQKFIRDPMRQQLEFQHLPTSYLRLAAHRIAQHYFLQSMVLPDNSLPDGSGSTIVVCKTAAELRLPHVRLADIPVILPQENSGAVKLAIKQRPRKFSHDSSSGNSGSQKADHPKSVEERKEEYNKARERIFNSANHSNSSRVKPEIEPKRADRLQHTTFAKGDVKSVPGGLDLSSGRSVVDSSVSSRRPVRNTAEKDPVSRYKPSNRVAIFRDREIERKDPDFDRSYDRYMQRFDPGFGFNAGPYTVPPMFTPAINYNSEFPQLGVAHRPQISSEPPRPLPQHLPGLWASPSNPPALGYGHPETMMAAYSPNYANAHSPSTIYVHAHQYPLHPPGMSFIQPHERISQTYQQPQQQQHDASLGLARPR